MMMGTPREEGGLLILKLRLNVDFPEQTSTLKVST